MELIDIFHPLPNTNLLFYTSSIHPQLFNSYFNLIQKNHKNQPFLRLYTILFKIEQKNLVTQIGFDINQFFYVRIQLAKFIFTKCFDFDHRILLINQLLKINQRKNNYYFVVNPQSGELICYIRFVVEKEKNQLLNIFTQMIDQLENIKDQFILEIKKILLLLNYQLQSPIEQTLHQKKLNQFTKQFKTYSSSSPYYTWSVINQKTSSSSSIKQNIYQKTKKKFRATRKSYKQNQKIKNLKKIILDQTKITQPPIFALKVDEDEQLFKKNLLNFGQVSKVNKLKNVLAFDNQMRQNLMKNIINKVNVFEFDKLKFQIQNYKNPESVNYERKLLGYLPQNQHIGIPRYYEIKNFSENYNCVFTNLYQSIQFQNYLLTNSITISLKTKFYIYIQIAKSMKYLKSCNILYHNLSPKSIKIKKGLTVKLTDFSHSYHNELFIDGNYQPYRNIFPYVSNIFYGKDNTIVNEKSDSYSLGALIFESLNNKKFMFIKDSSLKQLNEQQIFNRLCQNYLLSVQGTQIKELKLWNKFLLDCVNHKINIGNGQMKQNPLKDRCYFDWLLIILKHSQNYFQNY